MFTSKFWLKTGNSLSPVWREHFAICDMTALTDRQGSFIFRSNYLVWLLKCRSGNYHTALLLQKLRSDRILGDPRKWTLLVISTLVPIFILSKARETSLSKFQEVSDISRNCQTKSDSDFVNLKLSDKSWLDVSQFLKTLFLQIRESGHCRSFRH